MGKNAKKLKKFVIHVPKNSAMTPKLGLENGQRLQGLGKNLAMASELGKK